MTTLRMARMAPAVAVLGLLCVSCSSGAARRGTTEAAATQPRAVVENINFTEKDGQVSVSVEVNRKVAYTIYQQEDPLRVVLELPQTSAGDFARNVPVNKGTLGFIKPTVTAKGDTHLEFYLTGPSTYDIAEDGRTVRLAISAYRPKEVAEPTGAPAAAAAELSLLEGKIESRPLEAAAIPAAEAPVRQAPPAEVRMAKASAMEAAPEAMADARYVTAVDVTRDSGGTLAVISGDGNLQYEYFLVEGKSLVIDLFGVGNKIWPTVHQVKDDYIDQIRIGEHFQPDKKVRIVFDLKSPGDYQVRKADSQVTVAFGNPQMAMPAKPSMASAGTPAAMAAPAAGSGGPINVVSDVYFRPLRNKSRIEIKTTGRPEFKVVDSEDPLRVIVEVNNARIEPAAQKTLDLSRLERPVDKITAFQYTKDEAPIVRVVAQMRLVAPYRAAVSGDTVVLDIDDLSAVPPPPPEPEPEEETAAAAAPGAEQPGGMEAGAEAGPKVYSGKKLSLDFMDADVNDILRLVADVSGLNFVAGPEVKGRVTIRLADVPWDQALDIILKTNIPPLAQVAESDTIIRVTTLAKMEEEAEAERRAAEQKVKNIDAQKKLEPLVTKRFQISYAKITDIEKVVRDFTSDRVEMDGLLAVDERTNTIIVRDLKENVAEIETTIEALDAATPAVVVEARIIEVNNTAAEQLGVQWGANFKADPAHGNALPFEFPNSVGVGGTVGEENFMVNLPASAAVGGIGMSFGHIANTLSLDLRLQAMERLNDVKILSSPRVLVVQNQEATINLGQQLPVPATDAEGNRTVAFKDVGIKLVVTPQVTNDKRVFMDIQVEKSSRGEDVQTTEGTQFSIDTKRAQTKVLIKDGETAVIGGLTVEEESGVESGVPGLKNIPGLGWLFKSKDYSNRRNELMIFLTPRIIDVM